MCDSLCVNDRLIRLGFIAIQTIFIAITGLSVNAQEKDNVLVSYYTETSPTLDGVVSPGEYFLPGYHIGSENSLNANWLTLNTSVTPEDCSFTVYSVWNDDALYFAFEVLDDDIAWFDGEWGGNDRIQIVLADEQATASTMGVLAEFSLSATGEVVWLNNPRGGDLSWDEGTIDAVGIVTDVGYNIEIRFPWNEFPFDILPLLKNTQIRCLLAVVDVDLSKADVFNTILVSSGGPSENPFENHQDIGLLVLVGDGDAAIENVIRNNNSLQGWFSENSKPRNLIISGTEAFDSPENNMFQNMSDVIGRDAGTGMVRGIVRDIEGNPKSEVIIEVIPVPDNPALSNLNRNFDSQWETRTNQNGYFEFGVLPDNGDFVLRATYGLLHSLAVFTLSENREIPELSMDLVPSVAFLGRVVDAAGNPVSSVRVIPVQSGNPNLDDYSYRFFSATTMGDGRFVLSRLAQGTWRFMLISREQAPTLTQPLATNLNEQLITLVPGARLQGSVVIGEHDQPVSRLRIVVEEKKLGMEQQGKRTYSNGEFDFKNLRPAMYRLSIDSDRYHLVDHDIELNLASDANIELPNIRVQRAGTIRGTVVFDGEEKTGVPYISVYLYDLSGNLLMTNTTDLAGYYRFTGLRPGEYIIAIQSHELPEYYIINTEFKTTLHERRTIEQGPQFVFCRGLSIKGIVLDEAGNRVPGANIYLHSYVANDGDADSFRLLTTRSTADGTFEFQGIRPDDVGMLQARKMQQQSAILDFDSENILDFIPMLQLDVEAIGTISGTVITPQGRLMSKVQVTLLDKAEANAQKMLFEPKILETNNEGQFIFQNVAPGIYYVMAGYKPDAFVDQSQVEVHLDAENLIQQIRLVLP